jgi:hypothetical protein
MTKVLVYGNRKIDDIIIDASTPEKEAAAYLKLFKHLDEEWKVYDSCPGTEWDQTRIKAARAGNAHLAKELLTRRRRDEYEEWHIADMIDPLSEDKL